MDMKHLEYLQDVADEDVRRLREKESTYKGSWKKRGGVGCFMMLCRKWDRLENIVSSLGRYGGGDADAQPWDVFKWIECQSSGPGKHQIGADGTVLAEVRDLRRYLTLLEAEMMARGVVPAPAVPKREIPTSPRPEFGKLDTPHVGGDRQGPGTPEDGGHHAGQSDADVEEQILAARQARAPSEGEN